MMFSVRSNPFFKTIAIIVASVFLWNQVVWASGDLSDNIPDMPLKSAQEKVPEASSQDFEYRQEILIDQKNEIEKFMGSQYFAASQEEAVGDSAQSGGEEYTYYDDEDGRIETKEVASETAEGEFNGKHVKYYYLNEDAGSGYGRIYRIDVIDDNAYYEITYIDPDDPSNSIVADRTKKDATTDAVLIVNTYYKDTDNRVESKTLTAPDEDGSIYYHYMNEGLDGTGHGRLDIQVLAEEDEDGAIAYEYEYDGETGTVVSRKSYGEYWGRSYTHTNLGTDVDVGRSPYYVEITPDGNYAYVTNFYDNTISIIDLATGQNIVEDISTGSRPADIAFTPDGAYACFTNYYGGTISIIDLATGQKVGNDIRVGRYPWAIDITSDSKYAYVVNAYGYSVSVVDLVTREKVGDDIAVSGTPCHITITPDDKYAYITMYGSNTVAVIDLATNTKLPDIVVGDGPCHSAITPDGKFLYLVNHRDETVSIIDVATNMKVRDDIAVGNAPEAIVITPAGKYAYISNGDANSISVIDLATNTKLANDINVGTSPKDIAITPDGQHAYIVNNTDGAVSVIRIFELVQGILDTDNMELRDLKATWRYYASGRIHTETLEDGTIREYLDENWNGRDYGRLIKETAPDGSYKTFSSYYEGTDQARNMREYDIEGNFRALNIYQSDGMKKYKYEYDTEGYYIKFTSWFSSSDYYYNLYYVPSGRRYVYCDGPDSYKNEYSDENWNGKSYGRRIKRTEADGTYKTFEEHYVGTEQPRYAKSYTADNVLLTTEEFDVDGNLIKLTDHIENISYAYYASSGRIYTKTLSDGTIQKYSDENWNGHDHGKLIKETVPDSSYKIFTDHFAGTDQARYIEEYNSTDMWVRTSEYDELGNLVVVSDTGNIIYTYYTSGRIYTETLEDGTVREYSDEDWNGRDHGKLIKEISPEGEYKTFEEYYTGTNHARYIEEYNSEGIWLRTSEYDELGNIIASNEPGNISCIYYVPSGRMYTKTLSDGTIQEYSDENWNGHDYGKLTKEIYSDGSYKTFSGYYEGTDQARYMREYDIEGNFRALNIYQSDGMKKYKYEYDTEGYIIKFTYWFSPGNYYYRLYYVPSARLYVYCDGPDSYKNEYSDEDWNGKSYGRKIKRTEADGIYKTFEEHYVGTDQPRYTKSYTADNVLLETREFDAGGNLISFTDHIENISYTYYISGRMHTKTLSNGAVQEYSDEDWNGRDYGKLTKETVQDGLYKIFTDYFAGTDQARYIEEYDTNGTWLRTSEYDELGNLVAVDEPGDEYTYYASGRIHTETLEDGTIREYSNEDWNGRNYGRLIKETVLDGSYKTFTDHFAGTDQARYVEEYDVYVNLLAEYEYDSEGKLLEKKIPTFEFIKGVNLSWKNYGYDLGEIPGSGEWIGFASDTETLDEMFRSRKCDYIRLFLFCDLRSSMTFDANGTPTGFTDKVFDDMRALLDAARTFNIKLMPVLFDYTIADTVTFEGPYEVGEHPSIITDEIKKQALLDIFNAFFDEFASDPNIYAWDIINEPEYASAVSLSDMKFFVEDFVQLIHSASPEALTTVGSKDRQSLVDNWTDVGLDLYQFHYYDSHSGSMPLDQDVSELGLDKPVLVGEVEPVLFGETLDILEDNGYCGGLFWEDESNYTIGSAGYEEIANWFSGTWTRYSYYLSGRKHTETLDNGLVFEFEDLAMNDDGNGRLIKETYPSGAYKLYDYFVNTLSVRYIDFFMPDGDLFMKEEYDASGGRISTSYYYGNGQLKEIRWADGSWEAYAEDGTFIRSGEQIGDIEVIYGPNGRIETLRDGRYEEERQYVFASGILLYTLAIHDGTVKAVRDGYYAGTDLITRTDISNSSDAVSIVYDDNITVSYVGSDIAALSVNGGYVNFYNGDSILYQNSVSGDLYCFENGFLRRIVTTGGNVYTFSLTSDISGTSVFLTDAVIGGVEYIFSESWMTSINENGDTADITELVIENNVKIGSLKVNRGAGEETLTDGDPLFTRIKNTLQVINTEIPNIKFSYSSDLEIREILTGNYSLIGFQNGLISRIVSAEGLEVVYEFITGGDDVTGLRMVENGVTRVFDNYGKLLSMQFESNGEITTLDFTDETLTGVQSPDGLLQDIGLDADGNIESVRLIKPDGSEYLFAGGSIQDLINDQNVEYALAPDGRIISLTRIDTGEVFDVTYEIDPDSGAELIIFAGLDNIRYIYTDDMLTAIADPSGLRVDYQYDVEGRTAGVDISYGGIRNSSYIYEYDAAGTVIIDDLGNRRVYNQENKAVSLETPYGETYLYAYDTDGNGDPITVVNYARRESASGLITEYFKGRISRITKPDGSWVDNIEFDSITQKLTRFSLHTVDGKHRNIIFQGGFVQFEMEDSTRLIFYEDKLVAFGSSQGVVPLYDLDELNDIIYVRDPSDTVPPVGEIDIAASNWRHQSYEDSLAIRFVERDYTNDQWELSVDLRVGSAHYSEGEMFLDLRYDIPGLAWQAPIDMRGKEISFLFMLDDSFAFDPACPCDIQVFAKDKNWNSQYSSRVRMDYDSGWVKVSLIPTDDVVSFGHTDPGFNPASITMIGVRIVPQENTPSGMASFGKILLKHDILPDLFANVNYSGSPLDDLYNILGITRDIDQLGGGDMPAIETYLQSFVDALGNGPSGSSQEIMLNMINWHVEEENAAIAGFQSVYKDVSTGEFVINADLSTGSTTNGEGELYFDLLSDVPFLAEWAQSLNLTSRKLSFLVKVPDEFVGSTVYPNGARIFVKDANDKVQYGTWVNIKEGQKWYRVDLIPTFGEIPMGYTQAGFDPSQIKKIGINFSTQSGSNTNFTGEIRLKYLPVDVNSDPTDIIDMPQWMDLRWVKEYLVDEDDNYIRIPHVNYLLEEYFSYVFNEGSGIEPTANFEVIERSTTRWQVVTGTASVGWDTAGDNLITSIDLGPGTGTVGEILLDLRYDYYVPGKNWQSGEHSSIDMTTQEIVFRVRLGNGFVTDTSMPLLLEVFAKDDPNWKTQYGQTILLDPFGEWVEVTLTPTPPDFALGYTNTGFDPTKIIGLGLRIRSTSGIYNYTGNLEIQYELKDVGLGTCGLGDTGTLPSSPVWVNQRKLVEYIQQQGIALYGDYAIMTEVNQLIAEIPAFSLPNDFVAFTVYDQNDEITSITKPDGTTTWFDANGRMDKIVFESGDIFVDYEYGTTGALTSATLVNARQKLETSIAEAVYNIEKQMADALLILAEEKSLLEETFMNSVNEQRRVFAQQRTDLESMRYQKVKHNFLGIIWYTRVETPGIDDAIAEVNRLETEFNNSVAEQLAPLDAEIQAEKDVIDAEKIKVLDAYAWQKEKILLNIMREEAIPLIHYYYRDFLGRDAGQEEMLAIFRRIDATNDFAGIFGEEITGADDIILAIKADILHPVYLALPDDVRAFIEAFYSGQEINENVLAMIVNGLDGLIRTYDLNDQLSSYYEAGIFGGMLSVATVAYRNGLTCLNKSVEDLTDAEKTDIEWLNRYILQDLYPQITPKNRNATGFSAAIITQELQAEGEHTQKVAFKTNISTDVLAFLMNYMNNPAVRTSLLAELGLVQDEIIDISDNFLQALEEWFNGQDLHFGQSAFGALQKMLIENGVAVSLEDVARKSLLIDILIGVSGPMTDEKIEISMFTMSRVASLYGIGTGNFRLGYNDILALDTPFITLINGYHYVTILSVTETEVVYWDQNMGPGGGEITIDRKSFEDNWQGNVITDTPVEESKRLSDIEAKKIKGAFWWFLIPVLTYIFTAITAVVTVAINVITVVLASLITFVGQIALGIVHAVFNVANILVFAGNAFLGALGIGAGAIAVNATTGFSLAAMATGIKTTLISVGASYCVSVGLEALGVDPIVSGIIASAVTGGVQGFLSEGIGAIFRTALEFAGATGMGLLGQHFDFDPIITSILSMSTAVLTGASLDPNVSFSEALKTVATNVVGELSYYGVTQAGEMIGLDERISYLAGIGIRSSLQAGLGTFGMGGGSPGDWVEGAIAGTLSGISQIGINYLMDELELPPIVEQFGSRLLSAMANSLIPGVANVFENMYNSFTDYSLTTGGRPTKTDAKYQLFNPETGEYEFDTNTYASDMAQWSWKEKGYKQMSTNLTEEIANLGLEQAMDTYGVSLFDQDTMDAIDSYDHTSLGLYLRDKLDNNAFELLEWDDGVQYAKVDITDVNNNKVSEAYFGYLAETGSWEDFMGYGNDEFQGFGDIFIDPNSELKWSSGEIIDRFDSYEQMQKLENGYQNYAEIKDLDGNVVLIITPENDKSHLYMDKDGGYLNGDFKYMEGGLQVYEYTFGDIATTNLINGIDGSLLEAIAEDLSIPVSSQFNNDYSIAFSEENGSFEFIVEQLESDINNNYSNDSEIITKLKNIETVLRNIVENEDVVLVEATSDIISSVAGMAAASRLAVGGGTAGTALNPTIGGAAATAGTLLFLYESKNFLDSYTHFIGALENDPELMQYSYLETVLGEQHGAAVETIEQFNSVYKMIKDPLVSIFKENVYTFGKGVLNALRLIIGGIEYIEGFNN